MHMQEISSFGLIYKYDSTQWLYFNDKVTYCRHQIKATDDCHCSISLREKNISRQRSKNLRHLSNNKNNYILLSYFKNAKLHQPLCVAIVPKEWSARKIENKFSGLAKRSSFFGGIQWPNNLIDEIDFKKCPLFMTSLN